MPLVEFIPAIMLPFALALLATPVVIRLAHRIGAVDMPNERKVHTRPTPRLGGVGVCTSFLLSVTIISASQFSDSLFPGGTWSLIAVLMVFLLGVWDDLRALHPGRKFLIQVAAASIVVASGVRIGSITDFFGEGELVLGIFGVPVTILWIVGVANALNLIDGLDGLASGVAVIAALSIAAISFQSGDYGNTALMLTLVGAVGGFLPYNFHRARIFLGDSGSLVLGFVLGVASIQTSTKGSTAIALIVPILALGLPLMDTGLSMIRRILHSLLPEMVGRTKTSEKLRSMFLPDRQHIHHRLLALGFSHRSVVLILYVVSCCFGIAAFMVTLNNKAATLILSALLIAMLVGIRQLRYKEMAILRNGMLLPLYEWPALNRSIVQGFVDLGFCVAAFAGACALVGPGLPVERGYSTLALISGMQLGLLAVTGLYRNTLRYIGIGDMLHILKSVGAASFATGLVLWILPLQALRDAAWAVAVANLYLLVSAVAGSRMSYHVLNYLFRRSGGSGRKALIYGAGNEGARVLQQMLNDASKSVEPVGFLDENPELEGKRINGYPVFGGHWKLSRLAAKLGIDEIVVAASWIRPDTMSRIRQQALDLGMTLRKPKIEWEDITPSRDDQTQVAESPTFVPRLAPAEAVHRQS